MVEEDTIVVSTRITSQLHSKIRELINRGGYLNQSDFIRMAIREKTKKEVS